MIRGPGSSRWDFGPCPRGSPGGYVFKEYAAACSCQKCTIPNTWDDLDRLAPFEGPACWQGRRPAIAANTKGPPRDDQGSRKVLKKDDGQQDHTCQMKRFYHYVSHRLLKLIFISLMCFMILNNNIFKIDKEQDKLLSITTNSVNNIYNSSIYKKAYNLLWL